jgi:hypothetical protein
LDDAVDEVDDARVQQDHDRVHFGQACAVQEIRPPFCGDVFDPGIVATSPASNTTSTLLRLWSQARAHLRL